MKRHIILLSASIALVICALLAAQDKRDFQINIGKRGEKPTIAVPDFRGAGDSARLMSAFNSTLFSELQNSGQLKMIPKTVYPLNVPQQPSDFHPPANGRSQGPWLTDWSGPPVNTKYLAFGYAASQNNH
jgi:TolB protein